MHMRKTVEGALVYLVMLGATAIVVGSLACILVTVFAKGLPALTLEMVTRTPAGGYYIGKGGGILNAIVGSIALGIGATGLAFAVSVPLVFYLHLYLKKRSKRALLLRFFLDVLWGMPSIVYGAFGFTVMVAIGLRASLLAAVVTVGLLIVPIMARSMDEAFKMIPFELKEACCGLGATRLEIGLGVVLRQALPGVVTAILIAFGRAIGDAASVLFTAGFTDALPTSVLKPVATLPLAIFFQLGTPFPEVQQRGYAAAVVLTVIILCTSILARVVSKRFTGHVVK